MISVGMLRDVWAFRGFIAASVKREFHTRYRNTQFGFLWTIIQPLSMITIYTLVFAEIMKPSLPGHDSRFAYSIYLCAGVLTWGFFSELLGRSVGIFVQNANLLKKISFPKLCLPLILTFSSLINYAIVMAIFIAFLVVSGNFPGLPVVAAIPVIAILVAFGIGLGILLGTINVFYRDVEQTMGIVLQFWFWLTPIVYANKTLPPFAAAFLKWNPMWSLINAMHTIFLDGRFPDWASLIYPGVLSIGLVYLGMFAFWRLSGEIVDEL
ncbi:MAG: ABC transporter permease [Dissulfurimicrobium sp.]|uniref:ABC transporter permease n=1 Tax=Dissulfurimicrobium TaxID=1769732 RepID=UPI001EDC8768|nr:ABC transporter permease [Dissulfurimicrobium hydrothermale]UKL13842.1 ABC transporter permease [Dissulfurimicrobium hydrothermale]